MKRSLTVLLLAMCFSSLRGNAQELKTFSPDSTQFLRELAEIFQKVGDNEAKEAKEILATFSSGWNTGLLTNDERLAVKQTCTKLLERKLRAVPFYTDYLAVVTLLVRRNLDKKNFYAFNKGVDFYLQAKGTTLLSNYLNRSRGLLEDHALFYVRSNSWKCREAIYTFGFDTIPEVVFSSANLVCQLNKDSINIYHTSGHFYPALDRWRGKGGIVYWDQAGLSHEDAYAELSQYSILLNKTNYTADSVAFHFKKFFKRPLPGVFSEKIMVDVPVEKASYPQFTSYLPHLIIENVFKGIDYEGGFSIEGARVIGSGINHGVAAISIKRKGRLQMILRSADFIIRPDRIVSQRASVALYFEGDSIYHPGLQIKYTDVNRELVLMRGDEGLSQSPYFDSYHKVNIYTEAIYWALDSDVMSMEMIRGLNKTSEAVFESMDYYSEYRLDKLQGIDEVNPVNIVLNYARKYKTKEFYVYELSEYMHKPDDQVRAQLIKLANYGLLVFDINNDRVYVKDRLEALINARSGRRDYDVIQLNSQVADKNNAILDLKNFDLLIRGVPQVSLSDSQRVYIYPQNKEIVLKKNRDFEFTGRVHAGYFDFYAHKSSFEYDKFRINLPLIDSVSFMVNGIKRDERGRPVLIRVKNVISNLSGDLLIDDPGNKSGLKPYSIYPVFNSKSESYVYFDSKNVQNGVYNRENFNYVLEPFTIDSLNSFVTDGLQFAGKLNSGGIMPVINQPLKVQDDYSLGFVKHLSEEGIAVYGGKATFYSDVKLSNRGLQGVGTLKYLTSTIQADDFLFLPESMRANPKTFNLEAIAGSNEIPQADVKNSALVWVPESDSMIVHSKAPEKIHLYNNQSELNGSITLTPKALKGSGIMTFEDAQATSPLYAFYKNSFTSDTTEFVLFTPDHKNTAISVHSYNLLIDFSQRTGKFRNVGKSSKMEFPFNKYMCYVDDFDWLMDKKQLIIKSHIPGMEEKIRNMSMDNLLTLQVKGSEYISTDPAQDSLRFYALKAVYDIGANILQAEDARIIRVADAAIYPHDGKITIKQDGFIQELKGANILANVTTKYHQIYDASVKISSRNKYSASGLYDYKPVAGPPEILHLDIIGVDAARQTYAHAHVSDTAAFILSPDFDFQGDVSLAAAKAFLNFDGAFRIKNECEKKPKEWIRFACALNPADIRIRLPEKIRNLKNENIEVSLLYSSVSNKIYPAFFQKTETFSDPALLSSSGVVTFDSKSKQYQVADSSRVDNSAAAGSLMRLDGEKCIVKGEGTLNLSNDLGQVKLVVNGLVQYFIIPDSTAARVMTTIDFFFSDDVLKFFTGDLASNNLKATNLNDATYRSGLTALVGQQQAARLISEVSTFGVYRKFPDELDRTIVLSDVNLSWNPDLRSFISSGPIGISNIRKEPVNKYTTGYVEIGRRRNGDILNVYLELTPSVWYFFSYSNNVMQAISSNKSFNEALTSMKDANRKLKVEDGKPSYQFIVSTNEKRNTFLRKMHAAK
jgi:hypothetical protein